MNAQRHSGHNWSFLVMALAVVIAALGLTACGGGGSSSSSTGATTTEEEATTKSEESEGATGAIDGEGKNIAFLATGFGNQYSDSGTAAARAAAKKFNVSVDVFNGELNPTAQASQCQDAITSGRFAAIVVSSLAGPTMVPCAAQAEGAGIPLVAMSTAVGPEVASKTPQEPGVVANVFTPAPTLWAGLSETVAEACKGINPCNVVFLDSAKILPEVSHIVASALTKVEEENSGIKTVEHVEGGVEPNEGQTAMQDVLAKGTDFNAVLGIGSGACKGARIAIQSAGKEVGNTGDSIRMVCGGGTTQQMEALTKGELFSTVPVLPETEAEKAIEIATLAALEKPFPESVIPPEAIELPLKLTVDNAAEWKGFTGQYTE
jgi:ribose transport system substrate-binding protein